ncbi:hypothetical protein MF265_18260 [Serratia marcescens]|uniref:hypothetical protein n=1 Tax=Serratia marcescens TaxID=615 RepID=UPI000F9E6E01|nr:hypothetical protein [Serratia marcescens]ULH09880.1 hypothetical protein MF265_18260 [Serratia marcescens]
MQDNIEKRVLRMNREEVMDLFRSYCFVDAHGHQLENCVDFIDLVDEVCSRDDDNEDTAA